MATLLGMALVGALMGAAPTGKLGATPPGARDLRYRRSNVTEGKRLYTIGEQAMAKGKAAEAVALWRRAILLLPDTAEYDAVRHRLMMRLGYGLMVAYEQTGDRELGHDAVRMLERYADRHTQIFGDDRDKQKERAEIYELLGEAELQLERGVAKPVARVEHESPARIDEGAPANMDRTVVVPSKRKLKRPSVDDPKIRAKLNSWATDPQTGLVLTRPTIAELHPARGLVRMQGIVRALEGTSGDRLALHHSARSAFVSVRPALRNCFDQAFARTPTEVVRTEAELVLEPDGSVSGAKIVGAPIVDGAGNRCVSETFADARIVAHAPAERVRVRVPLVFFWQPSILIDEANGVTGRDVEFAGRPRALNHGSEGGMGPIEGRDFPNLYWRGFTW
ncbi:MAG TPA: hypothetical protein VG755_10780 [Nannocystaceae bacterium]|nr:hypothetical protein [Nannocystaceae bacterium]